MGVLGLVDKPKSVSIHSCSIVEASRTLAGIVR